MKGDACVNTDARTHAHAHACTQIISKIKTKKLRKGEKIIKYSPRNRKDMGSVSRTALNRHSGRSCNPSFFDVEAGRANVQDSPQLPQEFEASLGYIVCHSFSHSLLPTSNIEAKIEAFFFFFKFCFLRVLFIFMFCSLVFCLHISV